MQLVHKSAAPYLVFGTISNVRYSAMRADIRFTRKGGTDEIIDFLDRDPQL